MVWSVIVAPIKISDSSPRARVCHVFDSSANNVLHLHLNLRVWLWIRIEQSGWHRTLFIYIISIVTRMPSHKRGCAQIVFLVITFSTRIQYKSVQFMDRSMLYFFLGEGFSRLIFTMVLWWQFMVLSCAIQGKSQKAKASQLEIRTGRYTSINDRNIIRTCRQKWVILL